MPRNIKPEDAIRKKTEVEEAESTASFKSGITGNRPEERSGPGNVFLAGLPGSGKLELAEAAAEKMGLKYYDLAGPMSEGGLEAVENMVREIADGTVGVFAALPAKALTSEKVRQDVARSGALIYLMADMPLILTRFADEPERARREGAESEDDLRAQFAEVEPTALGFASAILRAETEPEELVNDLVDKLQVMGGKLSYDVNIKEVNW